MINDALQKLSTISSCFLRFSSCLIGFGGFDWFCHPGWFVNLTEGGALKPIFRQCKTSMFSQCPYSAPTVPLQCPYSSLM